MRPSAPAILFWLGAIDSLATAHSASAHDADGAVWAKLAGSSSAAARSAKKSLRRRLGCRQASSSSADGSGWNPPSDMAAALKEVWDHTLETYNSGDALGFVNYGFDQIMATKGSINYCVRWDSSSTVTKDQRDQIGAALAAQYAKWFVWTAGYDNFPYANVSVQVTGWATRDASLLEGDTSDISNVYTNHQDTEGIPECDPACGRFYHQDGDYSACAGGEAAHYDQSLWLTDGMEGGTGGDWGQRVGTEYLLGALGSEDIHILLHEMGHTFGLDDFYDWTPTGQESFIMNAGSATEITDFDGWMLRNWWYELSRDSSRGWQ